MKQMSTVPTFSPEDIIETFKAIVKSYDPALEQLQINGVYALAGEILGLSEDALSEYVYEDPEWDYFGDVNTAEYGGVLARKVGDDEVEFIQLDMDQGTGKRILLHGTIMWYSDFKENTNVIAFCEECGMTVQEVYENTAEFADAILRSFGCGAFEFNPTNAKWEPCINILDANAEDAEICSFLKELNVPKERYQSIEEVEA